MALTPIDDPWSGFYQHAPAEDWCAPMHIRTTPRLAKPGMHSENAFECVLQMLARCDQQLSSMLSAFQSPGRHQTKFPWPPAFQGHAVHCMNPEQPWQLFTWNMDGAVQVADSSSPLWSKEPKIWAMGLKTIDQCCDLLCSKANPKHIKSRNVSILMPQRQLACTALEMPSS